MKRKYPTQLRLKWVFFLPFLLLVLFISFTYKKLNPKAIVVSSKQEPILCYVPADSNLPAKLQQVTINDNRKAAGEFRNGIYYLDLQVKEGYWYPDSKEGKAVKLNDYALKVHRF